MTWRHSALLGVLDLVSTVACAVVGQPVGVAKHPVELTRAQVLAFRRRASGLDQRLPPGRDSMRVAAWAGLQDSMPRAALLSIHARVEAVAPDSWEDPSLVQLWGPRFSAYVVAERDRAVFTLGRLADDPASCREAEQLADRLDAFLAGRRMSYADVGRQLVCTPTGCARPPRPAVW